MGALEKADLGRKLVPNYMLRHKVKPGVTGWAQINGLRGETDTLKEKMENGWTTTWRGIL